MSELERQITEFITNNELDQLYEFIKENKNVNLNIRDENNLYPIFYAILHNKLDLVKLMIRRGAILDFLDNSGKTILFTIIQFNYQKLFRYFLEIDTDKFGFPLMDQHDKNKNVPLFYCIEFNRLDMLKDLVSKEVNIENEDVNGNTIFHICIKKKNPDILKYLLTLDKIPINKKNTKGLTPLHLACKLQNTQMLELLLQRADANVKDDMNQLPITYSVVFHNYQNFNLLLPKTEDLNTVDGLNNTILHTIVEEEKIQLFDRFISYVETNNISYNFNIQSRDGNTPLHTVFTEDLFQKKVFVSKLISKTNLNIQNNNPKNTVLHYLCASGIWKDYRDELEKKKLNVFVKNIDDHTCMDMLATTDKEDFMKIVVNSYFTLLKKTPDVWMNEWENNCSSRRIDKIVDLSNKKNGEAECKEKIKKHLLQISKKKNRKSYPVRKEPFNLDNQKIKNVKLCTFFGSTLDILFGIIEISQKHKNCQHVIVTNHGDTVSLESYFSVFIEWDTKNGRVDPDLLKLMKRYYHDKDKRFIFVPIRIILPRIAHNNMLVIDTQLSEAERFDANGSYPETILTEENNYNSKSLDKYITYLLQSIDPQIKYFSPSDFIPSIGIQLIEMMESQNYKLNDPPGFCSIWSLWYLDLRFTYPDIKRKKILRNATQYLMQNNISLKKTVRSFASTIEEERDKTFERHNLDINDWYNGEYDKDQLAGVLEELRIKIEKLNPNS